MIRRIVVCPIASRPIEEVRAAWGRYPDTALAVLTDGQWTLDEALALRMPDAEVGGDLRSCVGRFFQALGADLREIIILRDRDPLPAGLPERFLEFCRAREYAFVTGDGVMRKFSLEKVSVAFHDAWSTQKHACYPNGLLNGGPRFSGNQFRLCLSDEFRKPILTDPAFAPVPVAYNLDLTRRCNMHCVKCPYHRQGGKGRKGWRKKAWDMDVALVEKILDGCDAQRTTVYTGISGESLLHPHFDEVLDLLNQYACRFAYTSNATILTEERLKNMVDKGLVSLSISLDAVCSETYEKIVPDSDFHETQANAEAAVKIMKDNGAAVTLSYVMIPRTNEEEFDAFLDRWLTQVDQVLLLVWSDPETEEPYTHFEMHLPTERFACIQPYQMQVLSPEGLISPCCRDYNSEMVMGDLATDTLGDTWRGEKTGAFRASMLPPAPGETAPPMHPICAECPLWSTGYGHFAIDGDRAVYAERLHKVFTSLPEPPPPVSAAPAPAGAAATEVPPAAAAPRTPFAIRAIKRLGRTVRTVFSHRGRT